MKKQSKGDKAFAILIAFLLFQYGRPQAFFPLIGKLHPGYILHPLLAIYLWKKGRLFRLETVQEKAFFWLLVLMTLHVPFAVNNYLAYWGCRNGVLGFIVFLSMINFLEDSFDKLLKFINIWIFINMFCAFVGVRFGGKIPGAFFLEDENDFALLMNMNIGMTFFLALQADTAKKRLLYRIATCIFLMANIMSFSRGGFVGLLGTGLYIWLRSPHKLVSSFLLVIFGLLFVQFAPSSYWKEIATLKKEGLHRGTVGERWYTWKCGLRMFLDHPIFGVGQGNFPWNFPRYEPKEIEKRYGKRSHAGRAAHSLYVQVLCELGIVGTYLYFLIFYRSRKELLHITRFESYYPELAKNPEFYNHLNRVRFVIYALDVAAMAFFFTGTFLSVAYYPHYSIVNALMIAINKNTTRFIRAYASR